MVAACLQLFKLKKNHTFYRFSYIFYVYDVFGPNTTKIPKFFNTSQRIFKNQTYPVVNDANREHLYADYREFVKTLFRYFATKSNRKCPNENFQNCQSVFLFFEKKKASLSSIRMIISLLFIPT